MRQVLEFHEAVNICKLIDLDYERAQFTWTNNRDSKENIQVRLDRALATSTWLDFFPNYSVVHSAGMVSGHLALVVQLGARQRRPQRSMKIRRFEEKWVTKAECEEVVREAWNKPVQHGSPMFMLCQRITQCRRALFDWSRVAFDNGLSRTNALMEMMEVL